MKCPKCQADNSDTSRFCSNCATQLTRSGQPSPALTKTLESPVHALTKGSLVAGKYRIIDEIGRGGMGVVYKAEDTTLARRVAIKVLSEIFTGDPERLARFEREAKLLASLNHPNIATIFGLEEADGKRFLVMELVEGETLADRIGHGPFPLEQALKVCFQVAEGVEAAHEEGIIHRDLKPANVKITPDDKVKILDFGLAKAFYEGTAASDLSKSPAITEQMTEPGVILGTAAYMSPEQAKGRPVDKRADIWAFGVVLFEMLTGRACFAGESVTDVLAAVIKTEPDWRALPAETPPRVRELVERCLAKDARKRLRDIGDARLVLENSGLPPVDAAKSPERSWATSWGLPWILVAIMAVVAAVLAVRTGVTSTPGPRPVHRYHVSLPEPADYESGTHFLAISPDGTQLAYVGGRMPATRLYYRRVEDLDFKLLAGSEGATEPFFSPEGAWLGFNDGSRLKRLRIATGQVENITTDTGILVSGVGWAADQKVYFALNWSSGIYRADAMSAEATPEPVLLPVPGQRERGLVWPQRLPIEPLLLFTVFPGDIASMNDGRIAIGSAADPQKRWMLSPGGTCARYLPTGHVVYSRDGNLLAALLNLGTRTMSDPVIAVRGVQMYPNTGCASFAVSDTGDLVYVEGDIIKGSQDIVLIDRKNTRKVIASGNRFLTSPSVSPDGTQMLVTSHSANDNINVYHLPGGPFTRVTFDDGDEAVPVWLNNRRFAYGSSTTATAQMKVRNIDWSGKSEPLFPSDNSRYPSSISPDGKVLVFVERNPATDWDIWTGDLGPGGQARPFLNTKYAESFASVSPDGKWLAYQSNESDRRTEVYVIRFPEGTDKHQVSMDGGTEPRWDPRGGELYYRSGRDFVAVQIDLQPSFRMGSRATLFQTGENIWNTWGPQWASYAVMPDGSGYVFIDMSRWVPVREVVVVLNWFEELKRLVPTGKK